MGSSGRLPWAIVIVGAGLWWLSSKAPERAPPPPDTNSATRIDQGPRGQPQAAPVQPPPAAPAPRPAAPAPRFDPPATALRAVRLFTSTTARVRAGPGTTFPVVTVLPAGQSLDGFEVTGEWRRVTAGGAAGWVHVDLLADVMPAAPRPLVSAPRPAADPAPTRRGGNPVREPYVGRCDCPYDVMRNGRLCGGRSAYSRPGGRSPICYD